MVAERGLGKTVSKWLVFTQNFLFFAVGLAIIGFGAYLLLGGRIPDFDLSVQSIAIGIVVIGAIVLFVSFFGCCGSAKESRCMLGFYFALVFVVVISLIIVCAISLTGIASVDRVIETAWDKSDNTTKQWIFNHFNCCGFATPDNSTECEKMKHTYPELQGCRTALFDFISGHLTIVEIVAAVFAAFLILGLTLTCCLFCAIPTEEELRKREKDGLLAAATDLNQKNYNAVRHH